MKGKSLCAGLLVGLLVFGSAGFASADPFRPPPGPAIRPGAMIVGEVTAIGDGAFTVATGHRGSVTVRTNEDTRFRAPGDPGFAQDDIEVGDTIAARGRFVDGATLEARLIALIPPELADRAYGRVTAIDGGVITVAGEDGAAARIVTSPDTKFHIRGGLDGSIDDVQAGMLLGAAGRLDANGSLSAGHVFAREPRESRLPKGGPIAAGKVSQVDGGVLIIYYPDGSRLTITTDASTVVVKRNGDGPAVGSLSDVAQGSLILAIGVPSGDGGSLSARAIIVDSEHPPGRPRPATPSQP